MQANYWQDGLNHLKQDKIMANLINKFASLRLSSGNDAFITLTRSVVGQQISTTAAASIWQRLEQNIGHISPKKTLDFELIKLKNMGLSQQKAQYLHNIAHHFTKHNISENYWLGRSYEDIYQELITIAGIGNWTLEMFAIFYLLEPDIFPIKDLGLIKAIHNQYSPNKKLSRDDILALAQKWQPYRTVATWYLWRSIDSKVVLD